MPEREFRGTDRFRLLRRLGAGGMGVVYAAHDAHRDEVVALKTLRHADADAIYRLKREFRTLADVTHPNLVALYELVGDAADWYFTMELVEGVNFLEHARPGSLDEARLRAALRQVAGGLAALHAAGKMHRDLKPSNVLVTPAGRAVIVDFGIAQDLRSSTGARRTVERGGWGTPIYMAPEQAEGAAVEASDLYALGVMLYEALTGQVPFTGDFFSILFAKKSGAPPDPSAVTPDLPADLVALCRDLMAVEPERRPTSEDVIGRLGRRSRGSGASVRPRPARASVVGRALPLTALHAAVAASREGTPVVALISGPSGSGKTTVLETFLAEAARLDDAVILEGRCYVRETVPFKGCDGVLDSLSHWLLGLPPDRSRALLTPELASTARLFPAFGRLAESPIDQSADTQDAEQVRRTVVGALREVLRTIAASGPLVLAIDDFQWGDRDSAVLLEELVAAPDAPGLVLIVAFRSVEIGAQPFLVRFVERSRAAGAREIAIPPLSPEESRTLASRFLGTGDAAAETIARESGGSPFLIELLARRAAVARREAGQAQSALSAAEMIASRVAELPAEARALLETLAVAARPIPALVARDAADLRDERPVAAALEAEHLLRQGALADELEVYHDRIREAVAARLPPARLVDIHRRLADAMEARGRADPETLYEHCVGAGDTTRARRYAARAAELAFRALAFERAADLYRRAVDLAQDAGGATLAMETRLGDSLANIGRGLEAADVYLAAARRADAAQVLELRRRAVDQLLRCGHVERGAAVVKSVLGAVGIRAPRSPAHALVRLLLRRALLRLRGLGFRERSAEHLSAETIRRLDVCWTISLGFARADNLIAADYQTQHLLLALRAGEPYRVTRAMAAETGFVSLDGGPARARCEGLLAATRALAARSVNPHAIAISFLAEGLLGHFVGEFARSVAAADRAARILRAECTGAWWEIDWAEEYALESLWFLGDWNEVARRAPARLREAETQSDRYAAAEVAAGRPNIIWLVRNDVAEARRMNAHGIAPWSKERFHTPQRYSLVAESHIDFYDGRGDATWPRLSAKWPAFRLSPLSRVQLVRLEMLDLRARCALAAAPSATPSERRTLLRRAARDAKAVRRERMPWARPLASLVLASVAAQTGDTEAAIAWLWRALSDSQTVGLAAHEAAARRCLGQLLGGDEGRRLVEEADHWFAGVGGVRPDRLAAVLAPGLPS